MRLSFCTSIFVHLAILAFFLFSEKLFFSSRSALLGNNNIRVRTLGPKDLSNELKKALEADEKQIVQTDDKNQSDSSPNTSEKVYLSKHNQVVDKNTRAAKFGKFKNSPDRFEKSTATQKNSPHDKSEIKGIAKLFNIGAGKQEMPLENSEKSTGRLVDHSRGPASIDRGVGPSMTDDYLKDVAIGAQTLLNAQEYKFYSFYERVRTRLTEQWNLELRNQIEKVLKAGSGLGGIDRVTKVLVYLNRQGQLQSARVIATSGMSELDYAATEAFRISAPFPNPPKDMVGSNELVPLRWDFVVVSDTADGIDIQIKREKFEGY